MRASSDEETSGRRRGVMAAITEHWLPFLTAVLVLATAVVGLYAQRTTSERNRLQDDSASLEAQVRQLSDSNGKLLAANEELEAVNAKLRQQLDATTPTTSGGTASRSTEIFRQTGASPVVVRGLFGIDLDSQASNWGISPTAPSDLHVSPTLQSVGGKKLAIVKDSPTLQDCEAQTVLQTSLTAGQTVVGQELCVQTSDGRWAHVQITAIDRSAHTMSFKIVVWKLPTDP
jgi:hypothetical protein